jgi:hypothetical protein
MAKAAFAAAALFLAVAGAGFSRSLEYHHYTVTFTKDASGVIHAEKEPGVFFFEIDYGYGTDWTFVNNTGAALKVQFVEGPSRSMCHLRFSPAGSIFCESTEITIAASQSADLHADALDLSPEDYCWAWDLCPGELRAAPVGLVLQPIDPDLQIERDYLLAKIIALGLGILMFFVGLRLRRPPPPPTTAPPPATARPAPGNQREA